MFLIINNNSFYMFKKLLYILLLLFTVTLHLINVNAENSNETSSWINISEMTPWELLDFYKKNPSYFKKSVWLEYQSFIDGEYVVFRGELYDINWSPIPNIWIDGKVWSQNYAYTTNEKGIFNIEVDKKTIEKTKNYKVSIVVDWKYKTEKNMSWLDLLDKSIFHFKVIQSEEWWFFIETIKNDSFIWKLSLNKKEKEKPSYVWIQWIWFFLLIFLLVTIISIFIFKDKIENKFKVYRRNFKKAEKQIDINEIKESDGGIKAPDYLKEDLTESKEIKLTNDIADLLR